MTKFLKPEKIILHFALSFCILIFSFCILVNKAEAAILYLEPSEGEFYQEDVFTIDIKIDTQGEEINAVVANIKLPLEILEFIDFSKGNSILTLWPIEPSISNNTLSFIGGVPGGFNGEDKIGKIILKGKEQGQGIINFEDDSVVLLNDGLGTLAQLLTFGANLTILPEKSEVPRDEWKEELEKDKTPPEPFEIMIAQDPSMFEGKYFIIFQTQDKQTGISHYEVKEGEREWKRVKSPYLLENQELKSKILVKAVDKAGNEMIAEYLPQKELPFYLIIGLILIGIGGVIWWIVKKRET